MDNTFDRLVARVADSAGVNKKQNNAADTAVSQKKDNTVSEPHKNDVRSTAQDSVASLHNNIEVKSMTGKRADDITAELIENGRLKMSDIRVNGKVIRGRSKEYDKQKSDALKRAAELTVIPDVRIFEMYNMLKPYSASERELLDMAEELEDTYNAPLNAALVRAAAAEYKRVGILASY